MIGKYKYQPPTQDREEYYRIREWWNTFNAVLSANLSGSFDPADAEVIRDAKRIARRVANSVHGSIKKPRPLSWRLSELHAFKHSR